MKAHLAEGWKVDVQRGPEWIFARVYALGAEPPEVSIAERLWELLEHHTQYRLVLELDDVPLLHSWMIGQLLLLKKRIHQHGGMLRLCGLSDQAMDILRVSRLSWYLDHYPNRHDAVMGWRADKPR